MNLINAMFMAAMAALAAGMSYLFALAGEPQSVWFWCAVLELC